MKKKILLILLLILILWRPLYIIGTSQDNFFKRDYHVRYSGLKKLYFGSQYMIKKNPGIIPDQTLEAFAGGAFLKGLNPILIIHDQPPLGRYITALSIVLFDNENTLSIFLFFISLFALFLVGRLVLKNTLYSLLPVVLFSNEPLMVQKLLTAPLLELIQLPFIILALYFFIKMIQSVAYTKKHTIKRLGGFYSWAVLVSLTLGCVISIRFFVLGGALLLSFLLFFAIKRRYKEALYFCLTLPLALVVLAISYTRTIQESHSVIKPFSVQKYIYTYQSSKFIKLGTVWDLLLFNRWHTWWGSRSISSDSNWIIIWPISAVLTIVLGIAGILKKVRISDAELVVLLWVCCYFLMLSAGYSSTRYFLPLVPFLYILALSLLFRITMIKKVFTT